MKTIITSILMSIAFTASAFAAEFTVSKFDGSGQSFIIMTGSTEEGDSGRLNIALGQAFLNEKGFSKILVLSGPGGLAHEGDMTGKVVRDFDLTTTVMNGSECHSACANIWLHGTTRMMQRGAVIGFHNRFVLSEGLNGMKDELGWQGIRWSMKGAAMHDVLTWMDAGLLDLKAFIENIKEHPGGLIWKITESDATNIIGAKIID